MSEQKRPAARQVHPLLLDDDRGDHPVPTGPVHDDLQALAEEMRSLIRTRGYARPALPGDVDTRFVGIHAATLALYENAASQARIALPALGGAGIPVCVFEAPIAQVRLRHKVRVGKGMIRHSLGQEEFRFDPRSGELPGARTPLSPYIFPTALSVLRAN